MDEERATSTDTAGDGVTFEDLGLRPELLGALTALGYEEPTPIQQEAIPPLVEGRDLLGQAATGTGKTAAFALPVLQRLPAHRRDRAPLGARPGAHPRARRPGVRGAAPLRQGPRRPRAPGLRRRADRPPAAGAGVRRRRRRRDPGAGARPAPAAAACSWARCATVVLDEADEMLDMGFAEDLEAILGETPAERQTVLFSATMPRRLDSLARRHLREPVRITIGREKAAPGEAPRVRQTAYVVPRAAKPAALGRILDVEAPTAAIVFCRTREEVDTLTETLNGRGYRAQALHGGMSQEQRDRVMGRLRGGTADLLVATDVAARGLDIDSLTHVVNYDVPSAPESYVHRIGRVGRAGREGVAITLAEPREHRHAQDDRAGRRGADRRREGADGRRPAQPPAGAHPRRAAREPAHRRPRPLPRRRRDAHRRVRRRRGRPGRGQAGARGRRRRGRRRRGDPGGLLPAGPGRRAGSPDFTGSRGDAAAARAAAGRPGRARGCSSAPAATPASARATWSARSPARPA